MGAGVLVNLGSDSFCTSRLVDSCSVVEKLGNLVVEIPSDHLSLLLVAVKVLTNLSLDLAVNWSPPDVEKICGALEEKLMPAEGDDGAEDGPEKAQLENLSRSLIDRLEERVQLDEHTNDVRIAAEVEQGYSVKAC